jgi:hypothetical protein
MMGKSMVEGTYVPAKNEESQSMITYRMRIRESQIHRKKRTGREAKNAFILGRNSRQKAKEKIKAYRETFSPGFSPSFNKASRDRHLAARV